MSSPPNEPSITDQYMGNILRLDSHIDIAIKVAPRQKNLLHISDKQPP
jgi:hypothetical protein